MVVSGGSDRNLACQGLRKDAHWDAVNLCQPDVIAQVIISCHYQPF